MDVASFGILRERILAEVAPLPFERTRFLVIDDTGGVDPELATLQAVADVRILTPPFNLGHQRALVYGLRILARELRDEDFVVTLDADGEDEPKDLPRLLAPLLGEAANTRRVALAWRTRRRSTLTFGLF